MQGTIEQLPMASRPGSILIDGVGRAWFRPSDVLGGTPQLSARVSVKGVRRSQQSLLAVEVYILPPPLGPLEEGNDTRECGHVTINLGKALVGIDRRLANGKGGCSAQVEESCRAFLQKRRLIVFPPEQIAPEQRQAVLQHFAPMAFVTAETCITLEWNAPACIFRMYSLGHQLQHDAEALVAHLQATCFQGWKREA